MDDTQQPFVLPVLAHNLGRAAEVAGVSARTMSRWKAKKLITPRVVDGIELYLHEDIERLLTASPSSATPIPSDRGTK